MSHSSIKLPVTAEKMPFGDWIWFIQDADGHNIAQIMPSTDEHKCKELVRLINLGSKVDSNPPEKSFWGPKPTRKPSSKELTQNEELLGSISKRAQTMWGREKCLEIIEVILAHPKESELELVKTLKKKRLISPNTWWGDCHFIETIRKNNGN